MKELDTSHLQNKTEAGLSILNTPNTIGVIVIGAGETTMASFHEALKAELNRGIEIVVIDDKTKRRPNPFEAEPLIIKSIPRLEFTTTRPRIPKPYSKYQKNRNR